MQKIMCRWPFAVVREPASGDGARKYRGLAEARGENRIADDIRKLQLRSRRLGMPVDMGEFEKREARYRRYGDDGMLAGEASRCAIC